MPNKLDPLAAATTHGISKLALLGNENVLRPSSMQVSDHRFARESSSTTTRAEDRHGYRSDWTMRDGKKSISGMEFNHSPCISGVRVDALTVNNERSIASCDINYIARH